MADHDSIQTIAAAEGEHGMGHRGPTAAQVAAAVEAAYILEAVRK